MVVGDTWRIPHPLCLRLTPLRAAGTTPESISQGQGDVPCRGLPRVCAWLSVTLFIIFSLSLSQPSPAQLGPGLPNSALFPPLPLRGACLRLLPDTV